MATLPPLTVSEEDRAELEGWVRSETMEYRLVLRAKIVLAAAEGESGVAIADRLGISSSTASKWRRRYAAEGIEGLYDRARSGRPPIYDHDDRLAIVKQVTEASPAPDSRWTLRALVDALDEQVGISLTRLWEILNELDLKPWQTRSWVTSHDPDFWDKAADECGLYLAPPGNAVVYSVDEKTCIQATEPVNDTLPAVPRRRERRDHEYVRHGTAHLYAALDVHDGQVIGDTYGRRRAVDFIDFLQHLDAVTDDGLTLHVVADNGSSHVAGDTRRWLDDPAPRDRFEIHYTPTHASWVG